jgi:hypothetical protein
MQVMFCGAQSCMVVVFRRELLLLLLQPVVLVLPHMQCQARPESDWLNSCSSFYQYLE